MQPEPSRLELDAPAERVLAAAGVIDVHTADDLAGRLEELGSGADVRLDLTAVEFIDSSGLRALVTTHQTLESAGHQLQLTGISAAVDRLFEITGLREHLHVV